MSNFNVSLVTQVYNNVINKEYIMEILNLIIFYSQGIRQNLLILIMS